VQPRKNPTSGGKKRGERVLRLFHKRLTYIILKKKGCNSKKVPGLKKSKCRCTSITGKPPKKKPKKKEARKYPRKKAN